MSACLYIKTERQRIIDLLAQIGFWICNIVILSIQADSFRELQSWPLHLMQRCHSDQVLWQPDYDGDMTESAELKIPR